MLAASTLRFLKDLKSHNTRDWYALHRGDYEAARSDFAGLVDELIGGIAAFDPPIVENDPRDALFRLNRDTRFSKDKTPYKTNFGAFLTDRGRTVARAGYYIHLQPGACFIAGGLYMPPAPELRAVRAALERDARGLRAIIGKKEFVRFFGRTLPGVRVKTAPRGIPKDHPDLDLMRLKSYEAVHEVAEAKALGREFAAYAADAFRVLHPFIAWINHALDAAERK